MKVTISDRKLRKAAKSDSKLRKAYGDVCAKKIRQRLDDLDDALMLEEMRHAAGNFHELVGDRKGQWACHLENPLRMIFIPHEDPIPMDENSRFVWSEIYGVDIIEIVDYH